MIGALTSVLAFAALFAAFGMLNRGKKASCGCGGGCHGSCGRSPGGMGLDQEDGVIR